MKRPNLRISDDTPTALKWLGLLVHLAFVALVIGVVSWIFHGVLATLGGGNPPPLVGWLLVIVQGVATGFLFGMAYRRGKPFLLASVVALIAFQSIVGGWLPAIVLMLGLWLGYYLGSRPAVRKAAERRKP